MQNQTLTNFLKQIEPDQREPHNEDQGFAQEQMESLIVPKDQIVDQFSLTKHIERKSKIKYRQPKLKLTYISSEKNSQEQLRRNIMKKQNRQMQGKSLELTKKQSKASIYSDLIAQCVTKIKRTIIGQNIMLPSFSFQQSKNVKTFILNQNTPIHYETPRQTNTHGYLRNYGMHLIDKDINQLLKIKLKDSFIMPKKPNKNTTKHQFQFNSEFQSANLQFVAEINQYQYDIYLKNDTNTHGHQAWFNFRVKNNKSQLAILKLNICNIKRDLRLLQENPKIYLRKVNELGQALDDWKAEGNHLEFKVNLNNKFCVSRAYKLSFELQLQSNIIYQVSLLPSFSYSDMIKDISQYNNHQHAKIQILTYSLTGLAIPIVTFTNPTSTFNKNVILVNCRIHPGETNASFICKGLMKELASRKPIVKDFLERNIIKIIPMLNPDGVMMGNFRTNFLGVDLNRAFDSEDEIVNPEIVALKQIGMKLKRQYGEKFNLFLDLHGHSSQKNIFTYGPDYDTTETNFYQIRLFPKLLNAKTSLFKYYSCSFKLEDYKRNTARGFFLNKVGISAYTIEASYNCYTEEGRNAPMGLKQWMTFGHEMVGCLNLLYKLNKLSMIRNKVEMKNALNEADKQQIELVKKFKKQFKRQKQQNILNLRFEKKKTGQDEDSDGQNECEDYSKHERQQVLRRVADVIMPNIILPRVMKPSVLYPTVTPKLFKLRDELDSNNLKIIFTRRGSKYSSLRMQGSHYIHSIKGIEMLKAEARNLIP